MPVPDVSGVDFATEIDACWVGLCDGKSQRSGQPKMQFTPGLVYRWMIALLQTYLYTINVTITGAYQAFVRFNLELSPCVQSYTISPFLLALGRPSR